MLDCPQAVVPQDWQPAQWRGSADKEVWTPWRPILTGDDGSPCCGFWTDADWDASNFIQVRLIVNGEWVTSEAFTWTAS